MSSVDICRRNNKEKIYNGVPYYSTKSTPSTINGENQAFTKDGVLKNKSTTTPPSPPRKNIKAKERKPCIVNKSH